MANPFGYPKGLTGRIAGWLMAWGNGPMNDLALAALDVRPGDEVLEIGFGPGTTLPRLAEQAGDGHVAGIDPSETMISQASGRVRKQIAAGQVELQPGSVSSIPHEDRRFDRVLSVNNIYFWNDPTADLREIRRVVKPGGRFALVFRATTDDDGVLRLHGVPDAPAVNEIASWLETAGFSQGERQERDVRFVFSTVRAVALVATAN